HVLPARHGEPARLRHTRCRDAAAHRAHVLTVSAPPSESPHRWRALAVLAVVSLLGMSTWFSGTAVVRELAPQWRLGPGATSLLTIAVQLGFVAGALGSSVVNLLDIVPARAVLVASLLAAALVNAAFARVTGPGF